MNSGRNRPASKLIHQWKVLKTFHGGELGAERAYTWPGPSLARGLGGLLEDQTSELRSDLRNEHGEEGEGIHTENQYWQVSGWKRMWEGTQSRPLVGVANKEESGLQWS